MSNQVKIINEIERLTGAVVSFSTDGAVLVDGKTLPQLAEEEGIPREEFERIGHLIFDTASVLKDTHLPEEDRAAVLEAMAAAAESGTYDAIVDSEWAQGMRETSVSIVREFGGSEDEAQVEGDITVGTAVLARIAQHALDKDEDWGTDFMVELCELVGGVPL